MLGSGPVPGTVRSVTSEQPPRRRAVTVRLDGRQVRRGLLGLVIVVAGYQLASTAVASVSGLLLDVLVAWLISVSIEPVVAGLHRRGWPRAAGTGLVLLIVAAVVAAFAVLLGKVMLDQIDELATSLPNVAGDVTAWVNANLPVHLDAATLSSSLRLDSGAVDAVTGAVSGVFTLLTIAVFAFYLSADMPHLQEFIASHLAPSRRKVLVHVWDIAVAKAGAYMVSKGVLAAASAIAHAGAFYLLDVPYWLPLGLFAGLISQFIPTIGTYIGVAVPALVAFGHAPGSAVWVVGFAVVYQQVENYVFTPRVSRATMDMNPGVALGAVIGGAALLGPLGAVIGIPLVAIGLALADAYVHRYDLSAELDGVPDADALPD